MLLFIVSSDVMVELPKHGSCYVKSSLLLHCANLRVHFQIDFTETFTCLFAW